MYSGTDKCVRPVQQKAAKFTNHTKDFDCETLVQHRTVARLCVLFMHAVGNGYGKLYLTDTQLYDDLVSYRTT